MIRRLGLTWVVALAGFMVFTVATAIGSPAPVGWLLGSRNATLDGQAALPHTAVLSGDNLQVGNGLAMVSLDQGNRMIMGRDTEASFLQQADGVTVSLTRGTMSLYHQGAGEALRVKIGDVTVAPSQNSRTLGEVAMADGFLLVTARDGTLQVERSGRTEEVSKGKTITIAAKAADAPAPAPQEGRGKEHIKHFGAKISPAALLLLLGSAGIVSGTAYAIVAASGGRPASPIAP